MLEEEFNKNDGNKIIINENQIKDDNINKNIINEIKDSEQNEKKKKGKMLQKN